ncbi:conserved hypothetical protein [Histoplasma capsulatum G186AR]|uniref:Uncharacterized protein n=1 Tax=Ajellomyces capsulatus (strain G186AR / H82 / ATCC MYA-2454 / RMSCC 2432) TaxID=447093 RepID=C0NX99_AJECG|nr:uncharacterized protein HCBG_08091 [Histoplasma capsulatum G186AR]EEH03965.1 conserved hypothetical protein [Histoplasma capsulatum G186AR]
MAAHMGFSGNAAPPSSSSAPAPTGAATMGADNSSIGQEGKAAAIFTAGEDWDSEQKLVTALSMLQQMEAKIHRLRNLVPNRLLAPLIPIVNPEARMPIPSSPQEMFDQLAQAARAGVAEVENFQSEWRSPEMAAIWTRVDHKLNESGGEYPPTTGVWERDYDSISRALSREERTEKEQRSRLEEEEEKSRVVVLGEGGGWREVVEKYRKQDLPIAIHVPRPADSSGRFAVAIPKLSLQFYVLQGPSSYDSQGPQEWQVTTVPRGNTSKMEAEILECIRSRDRKWDLPYLLLPTIRKPTQIQSTSTSTDHHKAKEEAMFTWNAYHPGCL